MSKTDKFSTISIQRLFHLTVQNENEIFGIPNQLFFSPKESDVFKLNRFGINLETPLGVAAGPHSQMAQNIIAAWLCGARYIELKTIQTLDELEVSKPCIDMQDEGYNCEWSQELKIHQSFDEYLNAWIMIHVLRDKFGWSKEIGTIFNMSVGYNLEGILKENVQWFFDKMKNCKAEKEEKINALKALYPNIVKINIPDTISDNITLSTMHGCPPDEIEKIALYLIENKKLNTVVKLNPTLLGATELRKILNEKLEFQTTIPDIAFEHDLKYPDALNIIKVLRESAKKNNVFFGLKLTNTLEAVNHKNVFPENEKMMYMSGRALHPISINLAKKLQNEFKGELDVSFSAGADCFNVSEILSCGLKPITVSSDLLKPGGYGRMKQYAEKITSEFNKQKSKNIDEYILAKAGTANKTEAALKNLNQYADLVVNSLAYKDHFFFEPDIKTKSKLNTFDCIAAPCVGTCPTHQDIPEYMYQASLGNFDKAFEVILRTNPFPKVLGMVCDHMCQTKCTRTNYDNNLLIREVKNCITDNKKVEYLPEKAAKNNLKAAIIGAGPSGLSCAYFLALAGFEVNVYESKSLPGGMVSDAIPSFRLDAEEINSDIERIKKLGVQVHYNQKIDKTNFEKIKSENNYVYIAVGAQQAKKISMEGSDAKGVLDPLFFLSEVKRCNTLNLGKSLLVIGGGNTAMDVARTAHRVIQNGKVTIVYRRTKREMPAEAEEIIAAMNEGIEIIELAAPEKITVIDGKVKGLVCSKIMLSGKDESGRPKPVKVPGSEFEIVADTIIPALGQDIVIDFIEPSALQGQLEDYETKLENVYIGGDALKGAKNIISAVADGRKTAEKIIRKAKISFKISTDNKKRSLTYTDLMVKKSQRTYTNELLGKSANEEVISKLSKEDAQKEASRCLLCDDICNVCVTVCPNRANYSYKMEPVVYKMQKGIKDGDTIKFVDDVDFVIEQPYQILNIGDFCNECGNCTTFCPTSGRPFMDKPKFYLTLKSFKEVSTGYTISRLKDKITLIYKEHDSVKTLTLQNNKLLYETDYMTAEFEAANFKLIDAKINVPCAKECNFKEAARMNVLLNAAKDLYVNENEY